MRTTTARGLAVLGTALLVAIAIAACGGGGSSTTSTTSSKAPSANSADTQGPTSATGATGSALARRTALAACLKNYGVTLPSFPGRFGATGGTGVSGRRFPFGATGRRSPFGATGRRFAFGATGASGRASGFPGGGFAGAGGFASNPKLAQALQKCGGFGGFGGFGRFGATGRTGAFSSGIRAQLTSFDTCMKKHGETLPAPNLSGTGSVFGNVDQTTATFKAAYTQCKAILTYLNHSRNPAGATGSTTS
jgi:hypothetical protein